MFRKEDNSNSNVQNNFFLPLECEYTIQDSLPSKKKYGMIESTNFFPLNDSLFTSPKNSESHNSGQPRHGNIKFVTSRCCTDTVPTRIDMREKKSDNIQDDGLFSSNYHDVNRNVSAPSNKDSQSKDYSYIAESIFLRKNENLDNLCSGSTTFVLSSADEDVIEFSFDDNVPCVELLSGATLEKSSLTLNEVNKKLFNTLYDFGVSKDNPEENLVESILPNCVALLNIFDDIELLTSSCDEIFERSTFINTIEFIVHDIWVQTLTKNINLLQTLSADLKWYKDNYLICKSKIQYPSTNIVEILGSLKHFPNSILQTFKFGIELKEQDQYHDKSPITNYIVFTRMFCTIVLEIQKCFILIVKFMHSVRFLEEFSNEIFLSFIEVLVKIVFEHQVPQLFLGIDEIIQLWLKDSDIERRQILSAWCNGVIQDIKQSQPRGASNTESGSIASSSEDDDEGLQFNKWDVIEPFIDNINSLQ
ncbi:Spo77p [Saccharomyces paradoxus]|uniref:Spo77p n=1 Tax=Saccharomyces paradoxus TaxID=27291 RepID=A0A8B8UWH4_SACPA|nr:Spo77 [Saccharomyces paradoxus]QHS75046.1 Spo77 [Saccharomyces paradoxus]